jgi:hypothetical protein
LAGIGWPGSGNSVRTVSSSVSPPTGKRMYSSARVLSLLCCANTSSATSDAYMISGMYLVSSLRRSLLQIEKPDAPGSSTRRKMMSGVVVRASVIASLGSCEDVNSNP